MVLWEKGSNLYLLTPSEFNQLPDGIELESITGTKKIKGVDNIDLDTRWGYTAYGVVDPWNHSHKNLFLLFTLKE
jgi:hypothetical protein